MRRQQIILQFIIIILVTNSFTQQLVDSSLVYDETPIDFVDHTTVNIQSTIGIETSVIFLTEPDLTKVNNNGKTANYNGIFRMRSLTSGYDAMFSLPDPIPEPACPKFANIVKNVDKSIYYLRVSNTIENFTCETINNTFKIYYYEYQSKVVSPLKIVDSPTLLQNENIFYIELNNFLINSTKDSISIFQYKNELQTESKLGIVYMQLASISYTTTLFPVSLFYKFTNNASFDFTKTNSGIFVGTTKTFAFIYMKDRLQVILKLISLKELNQSVTEYLIFRSSSEIIELNFAIDYDTTKNLAYAVVSVNGVTNLYIIDITISPISVTPKGYQQLPRISKVQNIKVLSGFNFIMVYGEKKDSANIINLSVYRSHDQLFSIYEFSTIDLTPNQITIDKLYDVISIIDYVNVIKPIQILLLYKQTGDKERLVILNKCLFFLNGQICQLGCSTINEGENKVTRTCNKCSENTDGNKYLYGLVCVQKCPYAMANDQYNKCYTCPSDDPLSPYVDVFNNKCTNKCLVTPSMIYDHTKKVCTDCQKLLKFNRRPPEPTECVDDCLPGDVKDNELGICFACKANSLFYYNKTCNEKCPNFSIISDITQNFCKVCADDKLMFYLGKCVTECPPGTTLANNLKECVTCQSKGLFDNYGKCDFQCLQDTGPDDFGICRTCTEMNEFIYEKKCVTICPSYYIPNEIGVCTQCKTYNKFYVPLNDTASCMSGPCPIPFVADDLNICYECYTRGLFLYNNNCVEKCPENFIWNLKNECSRCDIGSYYESGSCVRTCSSMTFTNSTNICYHCRDSNKYMLDNTCVDNCPDWAAKIDYYSFCDPCYKNNLFYYNNSCLNECPEYSYVISHNKCIRCKDFNQFYFNGTCLEFCPNGFVHDFRDYKCVENVVNNFNNNCLNGAYFDDKKLICVCPTNFQGTFCQFSDHDLQLTVQRFEKLLISPIPYNGQANITSITTKDYFKFAKYYVTLVQEVNNAFSFKIFDDLSKKLSFLTRYGTSDIIEIQTDNFLLFDYYFQLLALKYLYNMNKSIDSKIKKINENNTINDNLRNLFINIFYENKEVADKYSLYGYVEDITQKTSNSFSQGKEMINSLLKNLIAMENFNSLILNYGEMFNFKIGKLNGKGIIEDEVIIPENNNTDSYNTTNNNTNTNILISNQNLITSNLSWFNMSECESYLRENYEIPNSEKILIKNIEYSAGINYDKNKYNHITKSLSLKLFHPKIKTQVTNNSSNLICPTPIRYHLKLQNNPFFSKLLQFYQFIYNQHQINILDKNDLFFNSRCYRYNKNNTYSPLTLKQRKHFYFFNLTSQCVSYKNISELNQLCKPQAISGDQFGVCDCNFFGEVLMGIFEDNFKDFSNYNIDVYNCLIDALINPKDFFNYGFILTMSIFCANIIFQILFFFINKNLLTENFENVIYNDCITLDYDEKLFPNFEKLTFNNNVKFYQFQYEKTIINQMKFDMMKSEMFKNDRFKHFDFNEKAGENNSVSNVEQSSLRENSNLHNYNNNQDKSFIPLSAGISRNIEEKVALKVKLIREKYFYVKDLKYKFYTLIDLDCIDANIRIRYDTRTNSKYFWDYILNYNILFYAFFKKSLLIPQNSRLTILSMYILLYALFNAVFYFENLIELRSIEINKTDFIFTITTEYTKIILSFLSTTYVMILYKILLKIDKNIYNTYNVLFWTIDIKIIKDGNIILNKLLFWQRIMATLIYYCFAFISITFCTTFCAVYFNCVIGWIYSVCICLAFDFIIFSLILIPSIAVLSRYLASKFRLFTSFYFILEGLTIPNKF